MDCLIHEWGKAWFGVTGDSFVVDVRKGYSPARLANYLGKYLVKGFYHREDLKAMGFERRWSCARNWPKPAVLETKVQSEGGWNNTRVVSGYGFRDYFERRVEADKHLPALVQVGDDLRLALGKARGQAGMRKKFEAMLRKSDVKSEVG